ncbi:hypothetical protein RCCS2_15574 [Roseobacter sp. CCS2]|nr:hypothetical protein RCCS2_15574 [Roseobacter sp. CCS2]
MTGPPDAAFEGLVKLSGVMRCASKGHCTPATVTVAVPTGMIEMRVSLSA